MDENEVLTGEVIDPEAVEEPLPGVPQELRIREVRKTFDEVTVEKVDSFLTLLAETGLLQRSCEQAQLNFKTISRLRKEDEVFNDLVEDAMQRYREILEEECHRRAVVGWDEPVFSQRMGAEIGTIRRHDPRLLELMLKRHIPAYRDKFEGEIKVTGGVLVAPITVATAAAWAEQHGGEKIQLLSTDAPEPPKLDPPPACPGQ